MAVAQSATLERIPLALPERQQRSLWSDAFYRLRRNRAAMVALGVVVALIVLAFIAPLVTPYDPNGLQPVGSDAPPDAAYKLGTDGVGRDELTRIIYGTRVSLSIGILVQGLILCIGVPIGAMAAYGSRFVDNLLMRFTDVMYAFPDILFVIIFMAAFGAGFKNIFIAIGLVNWVGMARLTRGQLLSLKEKEFVEAARSIGVPSWRILFRHMLPNALGPIIVAVTFGIPGAIFTEAALSFIGLGIQPPTASWGAMVNEGFNDVFGDPGLVVYPAIAIAITMMAFTFLGDGLRDALDPRATR